MVGRLFGRIATPPAGVELTEDELEVYAVTIFSTWIGLLTHASWVPLFGLLGFLELSIINIGSTICFVVAVSLCRRGQMTTALVITAAEVVLHAWIATYYLGVDTAFHALALLAMMLGILFTTMTIRARVVYAVSIAAAWIALLGVSRLLSPAYEVSAGVEELFRIMNGVVFVVVLAGITLYHSWRVTLTRDSRVKTQAELTAAVKKTHVIVEQMADGLVAFSPEMRVIAINRSLAEWLDAAEPGVDTGMSTSTNMRLALPEMRDIAAEAMKTGEIASSDVPLPGDRVGAAVATPLGADGAVVLVRDVTADKEVDRMKSEFTAMVSHELRTPLTSVLGFTKLVKKQLVGKILPAADLSDAKVQRAAERATEQLDIIVQEGERLTALINDVLDLAKMEAGMMQLEREHVAVGDLIERAMAATSSLFEGREVVCESQVDEALPDALGDADRLQQVLVNLISNAAKFTDTGTVTVSAEAATEGLRFVVEDTGPGIPAGEQQAVFEKFRQAKGAADRPRGTGLGLPICKEIVHAHGGSIGVESDGSNGTRFWFVLPTGPAAT